MQNVGGKETAGQPGGEKKRDYEGKSVERKENESGRVVKEKRF